MPGPAPKPWRLRTRPHRAVTRALLHADGPVDTPKLEPREDGRPWRPETVSWWASVRRSPMRDEYTDSDWQSLLALAELVDRFWQTGNHRLAAEIRASAGEFGLSPRSRMMVRRKIDRVEA